MPAFLKTAPSEPTLAVEVFKHARLIEGGDTVLLKVKVTIPENADVLEAFVYVNQGAGSTFFAGLPTGSSGNRWVEVRVPVGDIDLTKGPASVSAFVLLVDGQSISPVQAIKLHAPGGPKEEALAAVAPLAPDDADDAPIGLTGATARSGGEDALFA